MKLLVAPQKPYMPMESLRAALTYPERPDKYSTSEIHELLVVCRLLHLEKRLDDNENWAQVLSPGEQQRVAFVRVFLHQPNWLFLDEATSALDEPTEALLYELLRKRLPHATIASIAHRSTLRRFHDLQLDIPTGKIEPLSKAAA